MTDVTSAEILRQGRIEAPAPVEVLNRWSDGSILWLLASRFARDPMASEPCTLQLRDGSNDVSATHFHGNSQAVATLRRSEADLVLRLNSGAGESPGCMELEVIPELSLRDGCRADLILGNIAAEISGDVRSVYRVSCHFRSDRYITPQLRLEV